MRNRSSLPERRQVRRPAQAPVPAYRSAAQAGSPTKNRGWRRAKFLTLMALAVGLLGGLWVGGQIKHIEVHGSTQPDKVATAVKSALATQPLFTRHLLFLNNAALAAVTLEDHPEVVAKLVLHKNWLSQGLIAEVEDSKPVVAWQSGGATYGVNQRGVATQAWSSDLPLVVDSSNLDVTVNQSITSPQFVQFVRQAAAELKPSLNLDFTRSRVVDTTSELYVDTSGAYYLRLDTGRSVAEQYQAAAAMLKAGATPSQYIDLRLPYKAYYK